MASIALRLTTSDAGRSGCSEIKLQRGDRYYITGKEAGQGDGSGSRELDASGETQTEKFSGKGIDQCGGVHDAVAAQWRCRVVRQFRKTSVGVREGGRLLRARGRGCTVVYISSDVGNRWSQCMTMERLQHGHSAWGKGNEERIAVVCPEEGLYDDLGERSACSSYIC